ncbi:MAG: Spy/CpxP family protein refolding chaperone, partial [Bacteroidota bacterium]
MNNRWWPTAFFVIAAATGAWAQPPWAGTGAAGAPGGPPERLRELLKLTPAQEEQIRELNLEHRRQMIRLRAQLEEARLDVRAQFTRENPDRGKIERVHKAVSDLEHKRRSLRTEHWFAVREKLTPEQREIWKHHP